MKRTLLLMLVAVQGCSGVDEVRPASTAPSHVNQAGISASEGKPEPVQLPFYARLQRGFEVFHTDQWAAIAFYRQPSCIRADFNLLDFFDAPAAFSCLQTVAGFAIFDDPLPAAPVQVNLTEGSPVPIWFIAWPELQAAIADDVVTIGELASLSSRVTGLATNFREILHPDRKLTQIASGELADGRTFQVEVSSVARPGDMLKHVRIEFR